MFNKIGLTKNFIIWSINLILFFIFVLFIGDSLFPSIDLKGDKKMVLNYKDEYIEKGFKAHFLREDITSKVVVKGKVNSKKIGSYDITYEVGEGILKRKVVRNVEVKDIEKPKLKISKDDIYLCPGSKIVPEKVEAYDNYDGDISSKVKSTIEDDKITYYVTDSSGNKKSVTKKVIFKDIIKPEIKLVGESEIYLFTNDEYKDAGYTVTDNCDKDIQDKVEVSGNVDTSIVGDVELIYKAKDNAGNEASASRKVHVNERSINGSVYLTFDDGPKEGTTDVILDILKEEGVKATFFVTNGGPDYLIKREAEEGHTVALHTASHDYSIVYSSVDAYFNDLGTVQNRVKNITGKESKIIRFPGGASNTISRRYSQGIMTTLTNEVVARGYKYYDWNISSGDAGSTTDPNQVYLNVVNSLRRDRVNMVLMHDIKPYTRDALRNIIRYCKNNGYPIVPITEGTEMITQRVNN